MNRHQRRSSAARARLRVVPNVRPQIAAQIAGESWPCAECGKRISALSDHVVSPQLGTHYCNAACASKVSAAERLGVTRSAMFEGGNVPRVVRLTTILADLRRTGRVAEADAVAALHKQCGDRCPSHGELADPVVGLVRRADGETQLAFACPWCSTPQVREAWEQEGRRA